MLSFTKESTHYLIIANIWLAAMVLSVHTHDQIFCLVGGAFWLLAGWLVSRKEREV
jgi:ribosomal protein L11 methylase PrmA